MSQVNSAPEPPSIFELVDKFVNAFAIDGWKTEQLSEVLTYLVNEKHKEFDTGRELRITGSVSDDHMYLTKSSRDTLKLIDKSKLNK